jgi:DNA-binding winged helix-turn-helix (wHTH) protein
MELVSGVAIPAAELPHLTPTERRLLYLLQSRAGEVVSRAEVVRSVLDDELASARTVDVHIRALRKKLGPAAHILTYRGEGYAWDDRLTGSAIHEPPHAAEAPINVAAYAEPVSVG